MSAASAGSSRGCVVFSFYATKKELVPIRPVGKFLVAKALISFTSYQSIILSMFEQMDMISESVSSDTLFY